MPTSTPSSHVVTELVPDIYFSPGFYMGFWEACILARYPTNTIKSHDRLQKHREMCVGAIMAAANTKATGRQYFVGIPATDPPDILLMYQEEVVVKGKTGTEPKYVHVEVTRCDLSQGENLLGQALNKNRPAYTDMVIALDVDGNNSPSDYQSVLDALQKEVKIYPKQIIAVESLDMAGGIALPPGSYALSQLYPKPSSSLINRHDTVAFFRRPTDVIGKATPARGISTEWQDLGSFTLLPPTI